MSQKEERKQKKKKREILLGEKHPSKNPLMQDAWLRVWLSVDHETMK